MSGVSDSTTCPNCGSDNATIYEDWKPFTYSSISCLECGLQIYPALTYMNLEELNAERESNEMDKLDELPEQSREVW